MKHKQKRINQAIFILLLVISSSLLGAYYLIQPPAPLVTSASNPSVSPVTRNDNTLLLLQPGTQSGCNTTTQLTEADLLALPQHQFTTHHSWSEQAETFSGPLLEDILKLACTHTAHISLSALNDYAIDLDFARAKSLKPIVAHTVNGKRLSIREKGPLWVMVPADDLKITPSDLDEMLIWQLSKIIIIKTDETSEHS